MFEDIWLIPLGFIAGILGSIIGLGLGFIVNNIPGGILLGMGVGFLLQYFLKDD